jgi:aspartyl-tRNA(Asn)/glutamyl-tRNA(Gln) amidotransferase subunit C
MTDVSRNDVAQLATLSSLQLGDDEIDTLQQEIAAILTYVQQLAELDTEGVEPTYQVTDLENVWRDDAVIDEQVTREQLLNLAPASAEHQIKVPKVL